MGLYIPQKSGGGNDVVYHYIPITECLDSSNKILASTFGIKSQKGVAIMLTVPESMRDIVNDYMLIDIVPNAQLTHFILVANRLFKPAKYDLSQRPEVNINGTNHITLYQIYVSNSDTALMENKVYGFKAYFQKISSYKEV